MTTKNVCIAALLISVGACGGSGGSTAPSNNQPTGNTTPPSGGIAVTNNNFSPSAKTVAVGTAVQWAWNTCSGDSYTGTNTCVGHSVTFDDGVTSPTQDQGTYNRTFTVAGTYNYHCAVHGTAMAGTITVQ